MAKITHEREALKDRRARVLTVVDTSLNYDTTGPLADHRLSRRAALVIETWIVDTAEGRLISAPSIERSKAELVLAHAMETGTYDGFLTTREHWRATRDMAHLGIDEIGERVGVSGSTISRFENSKRHPDPSIRRRAFVAYQSALELAMERNERALAFHSYTHHYRTENRLERNEDFTVDPYDYADYIARTCDPEHFPQLTHLHAIRKVLPRPPWRTPNPMNMMLLGYGENVEVPA